MNIVGEYSCQLKTDSTDYRNLHLLHCTLFRALVLLVVSLLHIFDGRNSILSPKELSRIRELLSLVNKLLMTCT